MNQPSVLEQMNEYIQQSKERGELLFEFEYSPVFNIVVIKKILPPVCDENGYGVIQFPKFTCFIDGLVWEGLKKQVKAIFRIPKEIENFWPVAEIFEEKLDLVSKAYKFEVEEEHKFISSQEGVLFNKDKTILYAYPSHKTEEEYVIPDTVVLIKENAFVNNPHLKKLSIHKNVVEIEPCQFVCGTMIEVDSENTAYQSQDGSLYSKDGKTVYHVCCDENIIFTEDISRECLEVSMEILKPENVVEEETEVASKASKVYTEMNNYIVKAKILGVQLFDFQYDKENDYVWIDKIIEPIGHIGEMPVVTIPKFVSVVDTFSHLNNDKIEGASLYIPKGCVIGEFGSRKSYVHWQFGEWLKTIKVDEEHETYCVQDGVLFNKDKTEILCYPVYNEEEEYVVPDSVVRLDYRMFANCSYLKKLVVSKNMIEIIIFRPGPISR